MKYIIIFICCLLMVNCTNDDEMEDVTYFGNIEIYEVVIEPTDQESVTIINTADNYFNITGWTLGDIREPSAFVISDYTVLGPSETMQFVHDQLGFKINNWDEIIYLKDAYGNLVDQWEGPKSEDYQIE